MSLTDYLANNYLTADTKPAKITKRKKRKDGAQPGLIIADDDALGWFAKATATDEDDAPLNGRHFWTKKKEWLLILS